MNDKPVFRPMENNTATRMCSPESSNQSKPVTNSQPHTNSQSQHAYNQNSLAHTQSRGGSPDGHSDASTPRACPLEYYNVINFLDKIKNRFKEQPHIYKQFLCIIHTYKVQQENLKDSVHTVTNPLTEAELYAQVAKVLQNQDDLLQEFAMFLPDASGAAARDLVGVGDRSVSKPLTKEEFYVWAEKLFQNQDDLLQE